MRHFRDARASGRGANGTRLTVEVSVTRILDAGGRPCTKYMGDTAAPRIEIVRTDGGAMVEYWVWDNGIGIDPDYHAKVFEVF